MALCRWCGKERDLPTGKLCSKCRAKCDAGMALPRSKWAKTKRNRSKKVGDGRGVGIIMVGGRRRVGDSQAVYRKHNSFRKR
jgi:hypothetical protein